VFDPVSIRRTAFRHALRSEASLRFEKGQEARLARLGADRVAELVVSWAGGVAAAGRVDTAPDEPPGGRVAFRPTHVNRLLGTAFTAAEQVGLLGRVGIEVETPPVASAASEPLVALVPTWRRDLHIEADVAEEIARVGGYDAVPTKTPDTPMPRFRPDPLECRDAIRRALAGAGLFEVVTPALVSDGHAERLSWPLAAAAGVPGEEAVAGDPIRWNPLSSATRTCGAASRELFDVLAANERTPRRRRDSRSAGYAARTAFAEWWRSLSFAVPASWRLAGVLGDRGRQGSGGARGPDARRCRTRLPGAPRRGAAPSGAFRARDLEGEHRGRGRRDPSRDAGGLGPARRPGRGRGAGGRRAWGRSAAGGPRPVAPEGERDLAVVVAEGVEAGAVASTLWAAGGPLVRGVTLFDVYRGAPLGTSEKSLAWRLAIRADDRALDDGEVDELQSRHVAAVAAAPRGRLRA
jgi:phenylalanyl-tRNA synthetase beta chain